MSTARSPPGHRVQCYPAWHLPGVSSITKSRMGVCLLGGWGREGRKKREHEHVSSGREPLPQRWAQQQSDPKHMLDATRHAMEATWIISHTQLPSSTGLLSCEVVPLSSFPALSPEETASKEKAEVPPPHDSPNLGHSPTLLRRAWAFASTQNVRQALSNLA